MVYFISRLILKALLKLFFRFDIEGKKNIPKEGPFIIASNHVSYLDPICVGVACNTKRVIFMAKRELFTFPFLGLWIKLCGCIPVDRVKKGTIALKTAITTLKQGGVIGIFPEGRRSADGKLQKPEPGIGLLVTRSKACIIPMYISGTERALPKGAWFIRLCRIKVRVGKPIVLKPNFELNSRKRTYELIGEDILDAISCLKR